jgi:hypothetical protein
MIVFRGMHKLHARVFPPRGSECLLITSEHAANTTTADSSLLKIFKNKICQYFFRTIFKVYSSQICTHDGIDNVSQFN